ncbi:MAG TPA: EamA family transporter [Methylomirabilota bacterium]|nr:EamA family transporter [Methylomirabilota bacterium]
MRASRGRGLLFICLAAISWGTTGSVTAVLVQRAGAGALVIGATRMLVAAGLLLLLARASGPIRIARADRWRCVALGVCMAAFQACYFSAVTMTGIAIAALIAICSAPLIIALLAAATLGERLTVRVSIALALGVIGTALLILGPRTAADFSPRFVAGVGLALAAGLAYALYVVLTKATLARTAPLPLAGVNFTVSALVLAPVLAGPGVGQQIALGWPWLLYLGAVTTAGAYAIYTIGLRDVTASVAGIASLTEPLTATLLGVLVFGERLGAGGVAGALLLFTALGLLLTREAP